MYFFISRFTYFIFHNQLLIIFLTLLTALLFYYFNYKKLFHFFLKFVFFYFLIIAIIPSGKILLYFLEKDYFSKLTTSQNVDGILVLSGYENVAFSSEYDQLYLGGSTNRLIESIRVYKKFPKAKLLFSGGSGSYISNSLSTEIAEEFYNIYFSDNTKMLFESNSSNTYENILNSKELVRPDSEENWIIITSAFHMPRAIGVANRLGWKLIPHPVDYKMSKKSFRQFFTFNILENIYFFQISSHELFGLLVYRLMDRTSNYLK